MPKTPEQIAAEEKAAREAELNQKPTPEQTEEFGEGMFGPSPRKSPATDKIKEKDQEPPKDKDEPADADEIERKRLEDEEKAKKDAEAKEAEKKSKEAPKPKRKKTDPLIATELNQLRQEVDDLKKPKPEPKDEPRKTADEIKQEEDESLLSLEDQEVLKALDHLAKTDPKQKTVRKKIFEFRREEAAYVDKWERDHPGQRFNENDSQHDDFYANVPTFDESAVARAKKELAQEEVDKLVEQRVRKVKSEEIDPVVRKMKFDEALKRETPAITHEVNRAVARLCAGSSEDYEKLMKNEDGTLRFDEETVAKMAEVNPELKEAIEEEAQLLGPVVEEVEKLSRLNGFYELDTKKKVRLQNGQSIKPHEMIVETLEEIEGEISEMPAEKQLWNGRSFITTREYFKLHAEASKLPPEKAAAEHQKIDARYWCATPADVVEKLLSRSTAKVKRQMERAEKLLARKSSTTAKTAEQTAAEEEAKKAAAQPRHRAPSTKSPSDTSDNTLTGKNSLAENGKELLRGMF